MNEPEELSDVAMSEQNTPAEAQEEVSSGGLSLEAKAGLTLICLLAAAFSYMVWQKWKEMQNSQVSAEQNRLQAVGAESSESPLKKSGQNPENEDGHESLGGNSEPPKVALNPGEGGRSSLPPALNLESPAKENPFSDEGNPFAETENKPVRRPANIPTLEVPEKTAADEITGTSNAFDPFGDEFESARNGTREDVESPTTAENAPGVAFDPFGPEADTPESAASEAAGSPADNGLTEADPFATNLEPKSANDKPDPLATASDPFAEPQPQSEPASAATQIKTPDADPFGEVKSQPDPFREEPAEKHPLAAEPEKPVNVSAGDSYQEPLPLLEPVPVQNSNAAKDNPFGEYEGVSAGAAQASSVTQVSPNHSGPNRHGTPADWDGPSSASANRNPSPFAENPFAKRPAPANGFKRNPDGTYEIQQGDSYWIISRKAYGSSRYYRALAEYNRKVIADPQQMKAGKKIVIPPVQELERRLARLIPETPATPGPSIVMASAEQGAGFFTDEAGNPMYRVQENDTLTEIAERHLGRSSRWIQIYELNRDKLSNPNQLKIGTTLKLPGDASRVRVVRGR